MQKPGSKQMDCKGSSYHVVQQFASEHALGHKLAFELLSTPGKLLRLVPPLLQQYRLLGGQAVLRSKAPDAPTEQSVDVSMTAANGDYHQQSLDHKREQNKMETSSTVVYIA